MAGVAALTFSIAMLAAAVLIGFGIRFIRTREHPRNGWLMIAVGAIIIGNVLIWTV
jgi:hypothetical protein